MQKNALTFKRILVYYLVLCMVLIGITGVGFQSSVSYMKKEIEKSAQQEIREYISQIENSIQQTCKICDTLAAGTDLQEMARVKKKFTPDRVMKARKMQQNMQSINLQNNLYQNLHIYFFNSNVILSAQSQLRQGEDDIALFCESYGLTRERFDQILAMEDGQMYQLVGDQLLWLLRPVYDEQKQITAVFIAEYKGRRLINKGDENRILYIQTPEKKMLSCLQTMQEEERLKVEQAVNTFQSVRIHEQSYICVKEKMNLFNWECVLAIPDTLFWSEMYRFIWILVSEILVLLMAAVLCSIYFSRKTFLPIGNLMKDNRKLEKKAQKSEFMELVRYLIGGTEEFPKKNPVLTEFFHMEQQSGYLMAVICMGEESREILGNDSVNLQENFEDFVLENLLRDQIFFRYPGIVTPIQKKYMVLLKVSLNRTEEKEIVQMFKQLENFYQEKFRISMRVLVGKKEKDITNIREVYHALIESNQYLDFWNTSETFRTGVYVYGEILETEENKGVPAYINGSRRLLNCLESEKFQEAYQELDTIYREAFPKNPKYLQQNMYQMYGLIGMLSATLDVRANEEDQKFYQSLQYEERLFRIQSMYELLSESRVIFKQIIEYKESQTKDREPDWLECMLQYIEEHYPDPELNVSKIAREFQLSVPHVSRAFKAQMGKGVLEYIHGVKLSHAKEMLKNDCSIKNAAAASGYLDSQAFTRAFKRYEGITPSQYKEYIMKKES